MNANQAIRSFFRGVVNSQPEPPIPPNLSISIPSEDADEGQSLEPGSILQAEGQSFIILYRDAAGRDSLRRISVWSVKANADGVPIFVAQCHERKATRYFRVDRIQTVTDFDGSIKDPLSEFYKDSFGFIWPTRNINIVLSSAADDRWNAMRRTCRESGVILLSALALSDGETLAEEVSEILNYCYDCCSQNGIELSDDEAVRLGGYVRRLRPTAEAVDKALEQAFERGPSAISQLLKAGVRVIEADGLIHSDEIAALNQFSIDLTGQGVW